MIVSFKHKGLKNFYEIGSTKGIQAQHASKLRLILALLDDAKTPEDMNFNGSNLHPLKGQLKNYFSVKVNGNWRVTFKLENGNAEIVNYQDYH